ncbi:alpha/beta hydrolase [Neobacillus sp. 114]|uniref:alpha/beta fold hydrolase n=1 Tax=Neobacillus sp. 114 TaxID=3048535 RepID=UPI0024C2E2D5|nr:alpha/beta hydrolase [Neobacillus sp. 114]
MAEHTIYKSDEGKQNILRFYENYLNSFGFEMERAYVGTSFGRTHVLITGPKDGKPLFVYQGGNCINPMTLSWFKPLFEHYRVYAPDTIGHPGYSAENRISAKDDSFAHWISELMTYFGVEKAAFAGPSYGAGILLRLAASMPQKIACSVLICPAGIALGSKFEMITKILVPLIIFKGTKSAVQLQKIADNMSDGFMKEIDKEIIGSIFNYTKLEQDMPKLTEKRELLRYTAPTMVIAGNKDVFFPEKKIGPAAKEIIPNLANYEVFNMGHIPSEEQLVVINEKIKEFLRLHYS